MIFFVTGVYNNELIALIAASGQPALGIPATGRVLPAAAADAAAAGSPDATSMSKWPNFAVTTVHHEGDGLGCVSG